MLVGGDNLFKALPLLRNVVCVIGVKLFDVLFSPFFNNHLWRVFKIAQSDLASLLLYVCPSVHPSFFRNNSVPTGPIFMKFDIGVYFVILSRKLHFN